jgi:hypothetical protein
MIDIINWFKYYLTSDKDAKYVSANRATALT